MTYKEEILVVAKIKDNAYKREKIQELHKKYNKSFRSVFRDVVNASHHLGGYKR